MTLLALIKSNEENRTVVRTTNTKVVCQGQQGLYFTFTFSELKTVEQILHIEFDTDPEMWIIRGGHIQDKTYGVGGIGNVVGVSLHLTIGTTITNCVQGTTLTAKCVALGY